MVKSEITCMAPDLCYYFWVEAEEREPVEFAWAEVGDCPGHFVEGRRSLRKDTQLQLCAPDYRALDCMVQSSSQGPR